MSIAIRAMIAAAAIIAKPFGDMRPNIAMPLARRLSAKSPSCGPAVR